MAVVVPFPLDPIYLSLVPPALEAALVGFLAFGRVSAVKRLAPA